MMIASHLDAARSRAINKALQDPLYELRCALKADVVYLVFQRKRSAPCDVVSRDCYDEHDAFLPGETIEFKSALNLHVPRSITRLRIESRLRNFSNLLVTALIVPWRHSEGQAWLLVGNFEPSDVLTNVAGNVKALDLLETVKRSYISGSLRSSRNLDRSFRDSMRRLIDAERSFNTPFLLNSIASIARWLFDTSSAYVALPAKNGDKFNFVATSQIRTAEFRALSLGEDEGIGGLARRKGAPVRTTDYAQDPRLERAPLRETMQEGFKSAACTPLWWDGRVNGLLYIAHRNYRAFNDIDLLLLEQFANQSADALSLDERRQFYLESVRLAERERLAHELHDTVVRHLLDVGVTANLSKAETEESAFRSSLQHIQEQTQLCLDALRGFIAESALAQNAAPVALGTVVAQLERVMLEGGLNCELSLGAGCTLTTTLPASVAGAMTIIGKEALTNSLRHSGSRTAFVRIDRAGGDIRLSIEDDGRGIPERDIVNLLDRPGHLGLQRMRTVAQSCRGWCRFGKSVRGGFSVEARFPVAAAS